MEGATKILSHMKSLDMNISENVYAALITGKNSPAREGGRRRRRLRRRRRRRGGGGGGGGGGNVYVQCMCMQSSTVGPT